ncbi:MAG TPA: ribokinase [Treponema sp.]|nr:ribokinase [Treponema sp.]
MKILNFGSLNIDYVYSVEHFVRPGETLAASKREVFAGGKGLNQSIALARAIGKKDGIEIYHAGGIGRTEGGFLKQMLTDAGVHTEFVHEYDEPSGHTIIQVDASGQNCILLYGGANMLQNPAFIDSVFSHFSAGDYLVLQNEINKVGSIIGKAHEKGMVVFFNPSPYNERIKELPLEYVDYFLLNEVEAADISGVSDPRTSALLEGLVNKFHLAKIVLTLGKNGVVYDDGITVYSHGIYEVPVVDTTAAGDTFTGYFISCLAQNMPAGEILRLASVASSIAVSRKGAAPSIPYFAEVSASTIKPVLSVTGPIVDM